jgi:hypothetical protein
MQEHYSKTALSEAHYSGGYLYLLSFNTQPSLKHVRSDVLQSSKDINQSSWYHHVVL